MSGIMIFAFIFTTIATAIGIWLLSATVVFLVSWALAHVAKWIYDNLTKHKDSVPILVSGKKVKEFLEAVAEEDPDLYKRLNGAFSKSTTPRKITLWQDNGNVSSIDVLEAQDASIDEFGDTYTRFEPTGRISQYN